MQTPKIILASGSPRRRQLMHLAGIPCEVIVSNVDETITGKPEEQVKELALRKAKAVFSMVEGGDNNKSVEALPLRFHELFEKSLTKTLTGENIIIAADTLVFVEGRVFGKPCDAVEAFEMLKLLEGKSHTVYTGVALLRGERTHVFADAARVFFRALSDEEIYAYIATGEPFDKAGAYGVQERGAVLVDRIEGDFYTVVGIPISKVCCALSEMGYNIWENT